MQFKINKLLAATAVAGSMALASPAMAAASASGVTGAYSGYALSGFRQDFGAPGLECGSVRPYHFR